MRKSLAACVLGGGARAELEIFLSNVRRETDNLRTL